MYPFYQYVAMKGGNRNQWCATDNEKSWIKCNRGSIQGYEQFLTKPRVNGNTVRFQMAGRRCQNRWCHDTGHEGIKCDHANNMFKDEQLFEFYLCNKSTFYLKKNIFFSPAKIFLCPALKKKEGHEEGMGNFIQSLPDVITVGSTKKSAKSIEDFKNAVKAANRNASAGIATEVEQAVEQNAATCSLTW